MASKSQFTGMTGVYLVAAELSRRGYVATPTSRSAQAVDLLVSDTEGSRPFAIQVKTNAVTFSFWLVGAKAQSLRSKKLVYALVNLRKAGPEFYLVPSRIIAKKTRVSPPSKTRTSIWHSVYRDDIKRYQDNWTIFDK